MSDHLIAGDKAPGFVLPDANGVPVSLADFAGQRVVVFFFPRAFTPGCTTEVCDFRDNVSTLGQRDTVVVGISRDTSQVLADFAREYKLPFPMLSDADRIAHAAYGVLSTVEKDGSPAEKVTRSTFVIGPDQIIESATYGVDVAGHAQAVVASL